MGRPDWRLGAAIALATVLVVLAVFALLLRHIDATSRQQAGAILTSTTS